MIKQTLQFLSKASLTHANKARMLSYFPRYNIVLDSREGRQFHLSLHLSKEELKSKAAYESDREDEFSIMRMEDMNNLIKLYRDPMTKFRVNEFIKILARSGELLKTNTEIEEGQKKYCNTLNDIIAHTKQCLKESGADFPMIGSFAYFLKQFSYFEDEELWLLIGEYINTRRMVKSKNELLKCAEGITMMKTFISGAEIIELARVLEEEMIGQKYQYDLHEKSRILASFIEIGYKPEKLMKSWKKSIIEEINQEDDLQCVTSIVEFYVTSDVDFGSNFLKAFERKSKEILEHCSEQHKEIKGKVLSSCVAILNYGHRKHKNYKFNKDLIHRIAKMISDNSVQFEFKDYMKIIHSPDLLAIMAPEVDIYSLFKAVYKLNPEGIDYKEMPKFIEGIKVGLDEEKQKDVAGHLDSILAKKSESFTWDVYSKTVEALFKADTIKLFPQIMYTLPAITAKNVTKIGFEDLCYLYYMIMKEKHLFDWKDQRFNENLKIMRDAIKRFQADEDRYAAAQLKGDSNYYKLLEVVDPRTFTDENN